jgi:hypothetical protein
MWKSMGTSNYNAMQIDLKHNMDHGVQFGFTYTLSKSIDLSSDAERVGTIGGIFFGFAFGMGGLGAAALGRLADATSIEYVYGLCAYLPLIGLLTAFLPNLDHPATAHAPAAPVL